MAFCLAELNLWSSRSSLNVQDTDIGTFQFYEKGEPGFPADQHYYSEKQHFAETRGYPWFLSKRRPERLRDALKELEHLGVGVSLSSQGIFEGDQQDLEQELLQSNTCVCTKWRTKHCCQMLLSSGVLVTLTLSGAHLERVGIDKTLVGRLPADTIGHAEIGERFILLSLVEKSQVCQVYLGRRGQSSPELSARRLEKLSGADIKVSSLELAGGGGRRPSRRVALNRSQDVGVCWWQGGHDEVWPWSPVPSALERANLVLLGFSESPGLMLLSSIRTSGEPLDCRFSSMQPYQILTVELRTEAHGSTADLHGEAKRSNVELREETRVAQTCVYECNRGCLQRLSATSLPLPSVPVSWCRDPSERWLLLGLQDSSVLLLHNETGLQTRVTCPMLPSALVWHPEGGLIVVAGGQGELQLFDLGLGPLRLQIVSEEEEEVKGTSLQLARHVKISSGLESVEWAHSSISQGSERMEVHDVLLLRFHRGPLATLRLRLGVLNGAQLGAGELLQHRLRCDEVDAALGILGNMDWCMMGADCYRGLISVTENLLRKPLDERTEAQLEAALGTFYSPARALTDTVILEFRDPISRYARRFFHHLLRHQRFEKAFLLALDIGARDLFMDLHYVARDSGEPVLANVAQRKAQELDAEEITTSDPDEPKRAVQQQNEVCVSPIKTHAEWTNRGKARKNTRNDSKGKMDREMGEDLAETPLNPSPWPWTQTDFTPDDRNDQVLKDSGKLNVIHFGLV